MDASKTILDFIARYTFYTNCIALTIGLIGNTLNILVLKNLKAFRTNRYSLYLTTESISNSFNQFFTLISCVVISIYSENSITFSITWCRLRYLAFQTTSLITFYIISFSAFDQFCSTNYRLYLKQMLTHKTARYTIFICVCLSISHSILFSIFFYINPLSGCILWNSIWIRYSTYFYYPVLVGFLPITIASLSSLIAFNNVRRIVRRQIPIARRRIDQQITAMILIRVIFFVILALPFNCFRIYEINDYVDQTNLLRFANQKLIRAFVYSLYNFNFSINFYVYLFSSSRYRRQVKYYLTKKCWQQMKRWCSSTPNQIHPESTVFSDDDNNFE